MKAIIKGAKMEVRPKRRLWQHARGDMDWISMVETWI